VPDIQRVEDARGVLVTLNGEHDVSTAPAIREATVMSDGIPLVIDLTGTTFLDSSVLGVLLGTSEACSQAGRPFHVVLGEGGAPAVKRVLDLSGFDQVLPIVSSVDDAFETV
jgi:anti-sigma B factor antagonist